MMFKVLYRYLFILSLACVQLPAYAGSGESLTVDKLIAQGYVLVQGEQLMQVFQMRKLAVSDIETGEVFILEGDRQKTGKNDRVEKVTSASPEKMFDPELTARPPMLRNARYQIRNDMIIATDGVRSYRLRFYMKGDTLYGARDVDAGNVYFKVVPTE